jgi:hypothetical protein
VVQGEGPEFKPQYCKKKKKKKKERKEKRTDTSLEQANSIDKTLMQRMSLYPAHPAKGVRK